MLAPEAVPALDEAEDAQGVDVVAQGDAIGPHESLGSLNVVPGGLLGEEVGKKELAAEVVDRGDEGPFLLGIGGPEVKGGIVLDQGADGRRQDFPRVGLLPATVRDVAVQRFGARRDRRRGDIDPLLLQTIAQSRVVVARDGQPRILDQLFLPQELIFDLRIRRR